MNSDYVRKLFKNNLYKILISIWRNLNKKRKIQLISLFSLMTITGLAETINLSAIVPFLIIITNPEKIWDFPFTSQFSNLLGISNQNQLIFPITILFAFTALLTAL